MRTRFFGTLVRWGLAPVLAVAAFLLAPPVAEKQDALELAPFFTAAAALLGAFIIALAVLSVLSPLAIVRVYEIVGYATLVYLAIGTVAATAGCVGSWPMFLYAYLFAITAGSGVGTVVAITRFGIANMKLTRDEKAVDEAGRLGAMFTRTQATELPGNCKAQCSVADPGNGRHHVAPAAAGATAPDSSGTAPAAAPGQNPTGATGPQRQG
ncbi:hypothetical protein [Mycolicibacterium sphagni]|uniref:MARVEL domain-containing protein n=1 Tax=Mycolicibacterium sphagni TaxID=1786 RepID=A0ABX2JTM1_9MYCO|nr:hypothetical protein [Mycolicibacterium sphagni]NTY60127.1 hypothetical protein [Mycolicibacterium sphagni]